MVSPVDGFMRLNGHCMEGEKSRVPLDIASSPRRATSSALLGLRRWYSSSVLQVCFDEIRALGHRIQREFQIREVELLGGEETVALWMGRCAVTGPCTPDYIAYMQRVVANYPFLSTFDRLLLTEAWKAGAESSDPKGTC